MDYKKLDEDGDLNLITSGTICTFCAKELDKAKEILFRPEHKIDFFSHQKYFSAFPCLNCGQFFWKGTSKPVTHNGRYVCWKNQKIISF